MNTPEKKEKKPSDSMQLPLLDLKREYLEIAAELSEALNQTASAANYIMGPAVRQLEDEISAYLQSRHSIGVASGTDALLISLRALAITRTGKEYFTGTDEIITTPFTFTATGGTIVRAGATPVFADIDPATFNLDPKYVRGAVTSNTVGIVPVHLYGQPCNMDVLTEIASENGLFILEDVAQAFGGKWKGSYLGTIGDLGAFSFFPSKNLGCFGDGGMVSTSNDELADMVRMLRTHGGRDKYNVEHIGYNSRLDTIQAAVLSVKLKHVNRLNDLRRRIASYYSKELKALDWLITPDEIENGEHVFHQYTVRIKDGKRDLVQEKLNENGVSTAVYYPVPLHQMKVFKERSINAGALSNTEKICSEVLSLPINPLLKNNELDYIIDIIKRIRV